MAVKDWTGAVVGKLTVASLSSTKKSKERCWVCICSCGNEAIVRSSHLRRKVVRSCGCLRNEMTPAMDLSGKLLGYLKVIKPVGRTSCRQIKWLCFCDPNLGGCGKEKVISGVSLRGGKSRSCGCLSLESFTLMKEHLQRLPEGVAASHLLLANYKRRAAAKERLWDLTDGTFYSITRLPCYYCGKPPVQVIRGAKANNGGYTYNGIDRIDSNLGYTETNCTPCCKTCNWMKNSLTVSEFYDHIDRIQSYKQQQKVEVA